MDRRTDGLSKQVETDPTAGAWKIVGHRMTTMYSTPSGAVMIAIEFGPTFETCAPAVVMGHESGKPYRWVGLDGRTYEAAGPPQISDESCSVSPEPSFTVS